ncbi:Hydroxypyruvate reductase [Alphaproteobacteria bacterium SO-S41]|nr:Hydroxypyruvate reductase [Alphaproteobacteria bacterium SO-S41]
MKALLHYRASPGFRAALSEIRDAEIAIVDEFDDAAFARESADADVLLHVLKPVTAAMMDGAPKLKLIQKIGVGVNTIDLEAAKARGIAVCNMPGTNSQAVAEMALTLMLAVLRRVAVFDPQTRAGNGWKPEAAVLDQVGEIAGRTVGFFGFGASASRLAPVLEALGASVIYTARSPKVGREAQFRSLEALLAEADILSLHAPATPETRGLIGADSIARMKRGAIIINTARGELIDEVALVAALQSGQLSGAGLDVFAQEPVDPANPLLTLSNVVVMPHLAWLTPETLRRSMSVALENCRRVAAGTELLHRVA